MNSIYITIFINIFAKPKTIQDIDELITVLFNYT